MARQRRTIKSFLLSYFILFFFFASVLSIVLSLPVFRIKNVEIEGTNIISKNELIKMLNVKYGHNIFFYDFGDIKDVLHKIPQIKDYGIYRKPPATVYIKIIERKPFVVLICGSESMIADLDGFILKVTSGKERSFSERFVDIQNISELPVIRGLNKKMVGKDFILPSSTVSLIRDSIGNLSKFLDPRSLQIEIDQDENINLLVQDILNVKLGKMEKMEEKIFILKALLATLEGKWDKVKYIDIRYPKNPVIVYR